MGVIVQRHRVIVEGEGCAKIPYDLDFYYTFFERLSKALDMRILVPPVLVRVPVLHSADSIHTEKDFGISGHVIWLESGAQVHTWPEASFVALDVFSCKMFLLEDAIAEFEDAFCPKTLTAYVPAVLYSRTDGDLP